MESNNSIIDAKKELICSDSFQAALDNASATSLEINGTLKTNNKTNYEVFYDIMLKSRTDIEEILDKKKKNRTPAEEEEVKKFKKQTSSKYKQVREMIYEPKGDSLDDNGVTKPLPKKLAALIDRFANVYQILKYIGHNELEEELKRRGISVVATPLENVSDVFQNDAIHQSINEVFETACKIQGSIDDAKSEIEDVIFPSQVPVELQYDKSLNPSGIKMSDFNKLIALQVKKMRAMTDDAKEKVDEQLENAAVAKHCDMVRSEVLREKYMIMGGDDRDGGEDAEG